MLAKLYKELQRRKVFRVLIAYLIAAWLLLQIAEVLSGILSLPDWAPKLVLLLLVIGLIPALLMAWAFELTPDGIKRDADVTGVSGQPGSSRFGVAAIVVGLLLAAGLGAGMLYLSGAGTRWAQNVALPLIEQHVAADEWEQAYAVALEVQERLPDSTILDGYWSEFSIKMSMPSNPEGATVHRRAYDKPQAQWQWLGETPTHEARIPRGFSLLRIELDGFDTVLRTIGGMPIAGGAISMGVGEDSTGTTYFVPPIEVVLDASGPREIAEVRVPGTQLFLDGQLVPLADFRIGQFEVTNREYREFVNAGGYRQRDLWEHEFVRDGQVISWEEAMAAFTDSTGRPGPGTWIGGSFADGQADFPVGGISWYEAEAFARFAGRELPTVHHWRRAHAEATLTWQVPASNVETSGVAAVGQYDGTGWTGTSDMLGNVREWCVNALGEQRVIVGGAWSDARYAISGTITNPAALPPLDRAPENGLRLVSVHDDRDVRAILRQPIKPKEKIQVTKPASDEAFAAMLRNFEYSSAPLNASIDATVGIKNWTRQQISFDRGDGERVELLLYLPDSNASRHRVMVFWPSSLAKTLTSLDGFRLYLDFMLRNGWAVAMPIFEGTFHRGDGHPVPYSTIAGRDLTIRQVREMRRSIDYLETRPDMDTESLVLYGFSWGGGMGAMALVAEPRFKVGILNQAGLSRSKHYDIKPEHYLIRVQQPVLQFNGRFDTSYRYEDSAKPFFDLLGSESKKHVVEPTGHFAPNSVVIRETLAWLDEHL